MRKNFGAKSCLFPMPVLIVGSYDENGVPNAMNAAWGGIYDDYQISICIAPNHKTAKNLLLKKAFTVSIADVNNVQCVDYVGIVSGNKEPNKLEKTNWPIEKSNFINKKRR